MVKRYKPSLSAIFLIIGGGSSVEVTEFSATDSYSNLRLTFKKYEIINL